MLMCFLCLFSFFVFFKQKTAYEMRISDWSSDVCSSDLQMTANVVGAIAPRLEHAEIERAKHKPTESLDAYDYYLRAMANLHFGAREAVDEALRLLYKAISLDSDYAPAHGMAAWCTVWLKVNGWAHDRAQEMDVGERTRGWEGKRGGRR